MAKEAFIVHNCLGGRTNEAPEGHLFVAALHAAANDMRLILFGPGTPEISCSNAGRYSVLRYKDRSGNGVIEVVPLVVGEHLAFHGKNSADPTRASRLQLRFPDYIRPASAPNIGGWMLVGVSAVNLVGLVNKIKAQFLCRLLASPPLEVPELQGMPSAVLLNMLSYLPAAGLCRAAATCTALAENANASELWELLLLRDFGATNRSGQAKQEYKRRYEEVEQRSSSRPRYEVEDDFYIPFFQIFPRDRYSPFPRAPFQPHFPASPFDPVPLAPPIPPYIDPVLPSLRPPRGSIIDPPHPPRGPFGFSFSI